MIFVTVGTAHYDPLIKEIDRLVGEKLIDDNVIAQIGRGSYIPKNFRYFRFMRSLKSAYDKADVIVSTGGAGTTIECVKRGLRLVVIENTTLMEGHQSQLIGEMVRRKHLVWCKSINAIIMSIKEARQRIFEPFSTDTPRAHILINELLKDNK